MAAGLAGCGSINTDPGAVAAIQFDSLPSPSVVVGDTLRDTLGVARRLRATAFNLEGQPITGAMLRYRSPDRGVRVDSVTGIVTADSARATPARIIAQAGGLQSAPDSLYVVQTPDSILAVNPRDSLLYSLRDSTLNVSPALSARLVHRSGGTLDPVQQYIVSYAVVYPQDTLRAQLVGDNSYRGSRLDTTDATGTTGRRIRIRPVNLVSTTDSVIVLATARYRGRVVAGAPVRFVLLVRPRP